MSLESLAAACSNASRKYPLNLSFARKGIDVVKDKKAVRPDEVIPPDSGAGIQARQLAVDAALMLPNLIKLLGRLLKDPRVPRRSKLLLGASLAYVLSPIDLLPEFIPVAGLLDDIFLATFALNHLIERAG